MKHTLRRARQRYDRNLNSKRLEKILRNKNRIQLKYNKMTGKSAWAYRHADIWYIIGKHGATTKTLLPYTAEFHNLLMKKLSKLERSDEVFDYPDEAQNPADEALGLSDDPYFEDLMRDMGLLKDPPHVSENEDV